MDERHTVFIFYDQNGDDDAISNSFIKKAKKQSPKAAKTIKFKSEPGT